MQKYLRMSKFFVTFAAVLYVVHTYARMETL